MKEVEKFINNNKFPIVGLLLFIVFNKKIISLFDEHFVHGILDTVQMSNLLFDVIVVFTFLFFLFYGWYRGFHGKRYKISNIWYLFFVIVYMYYRMIDVNQWERVSLSISYINSVAMSDLVVAPLFAWFLNVITLSARKVRLNKSKKSNIVGVGFHADSAIKIPSDDNSNRYSFLLDLKEHIIATKDFNKSFAIGLIGKWGYGKTSFMDTLYDELSERDFIKIKFNPWMFNPAKNIATAFFKQFGDSIAEYDSSLKGDISEYVSELLNDVDNNYLNVASKLFNNKIDIEEHYKKIDDSIKKLDKRVIVFIDDLDRLDKVEVVEVLRIIRNTADFSNTFFIVAFDKSYIIQSLKGIIEYKSESFLDKIFQLEYYLPPLTQKSIQEKLHYELDSVLDIDGKRKLKEYVQHINEYGNYEGFGVSDIPIESMREVYRYVNVFILIYKRLSGEIYFPDLYRIVYLRLKYPEVYYLLYHNRSEILTSLQSNGMSMSDTNYLRLSKIDKGDDSNWVNTNLYSTLNKSPKTYGLTEDDVLKVVAVVNSIFPMKERLGSYGLSKKLSNAHLNINIPSCFDRYFDLSMQSSLSELEFSSARAGTFDIFSDSITKWNEDANIREDLKSRLAIITEFDNREDYEKIMRSIMYYYNLPRDDGRKHYMDETRLHKFIYEQLGGINSESIDKMTKAYYLNDRDTYKKFINELFSDNLKSGFVLELLTKLIHSFPEFILSREELKGIITTKFIDEIDNYDQNYFDIWQYFHVIVRFTPSEAESVTINADAVEYADKMKSYLLNKGLDTFLEDSVQPCRRAGGMGVSIGGWINILWGTMDTFLIELQAITIQSEYKEEFIAFATTYKNSGGNCIEYEFQKIPTRV